MDRAKPITPGTGSTHPTPSSLAPCPLLLWLTPDTWHLALSRHPTPRMRYHKIRYRSKSISPQRSLSTQRLSKILFSAFSANSAVNAYVFFSIRPTVFSPAAGLTPATSITYLRILRRSNDLRFKPGSSHPERLRQPVDRLSRRLEGIDRYRCPPCYASPRTGPQQRSPCLPKRKGATFALPEC